MWIIAGCAAAFGGAWAHAQFAGDTAPPFATVTYRGYLEDDGVPIEGQIDLSASLFDAPEGGTALTAAPITVADVDVSGGHFAAQLTLPVETLSVPEAWLALSVDFGSGFVDLDGRQRLTSMPYAELANRANNAANGNPPGTIAAFGGDQAPAGWLLCDGSAVSRSGYPSLFSAIDTKWGVGDGSTTFNVPDLRGRVAVGAGQGPGLTSRMLGQTVGEEAHQLTVDEMPSHSHTLATVPSWDDGGGYSGGGWFGDPRLMATSSTGGSQPHNNMQPSAFVNYIIKY